MRCFTKALKHNFLRKHGFPCKTLHAVRRQIDRSLAPQQLVRDRTSDGGGLHAMPRRDGTTTTAAPPGTLVLNRDLRLVSWTPSARSWIDALPSAEMFARWGMLPSVVYPTAVLARSQDSAEAARALVQAADGRWVTIEAAALEGEREGEVAVQLRSATAGETFELLCRVYALSPRERDVVSLLVAGLDTRAIAKRLFISPHTVQDHLKSVFAKVGIHSRRELLATLSAASD